MFATTPIRLFLLFGLLALLGFAGAAWTAGAPAAVLVGVAGALLAACAVVVEIDRHDQATSAPWQARR